MEVEAAAHTSQVAVPSYQLDQFSLPTQKSPQLQMLTARARYCYKICDLKKMQTKFKNSAYLCSLLKLQALDGIVIQCST
jgi:hypothetical protein